MLLIPAIDLKNGNVVRLFQGNSEDETVYSRNPVAMARHWHAEGARMLHVVDLDGAFTGEPQNLQAVQKIIEATGLAVEFGGGVRSHETLRTLFHLGVNRVVLGTKAVSDAAFLRQAFEEYGKQVIVSIDARNGRVLTEGWINASGLEAVEFAAGLKFIGFDEVIYTDTSKDGTLRGPNLEGIRALADRTGLRVVASGGISSLDDLSQLKDLGERVTGAIIGKALYEERFSLKEALRSVQ